MSEFTPGPWRVVDRTDVLALEGTPDSIVVASTRFFEGHPTDQQVADALLIAAAPDLLAACKTFLRKQFVDPGGPYMQDMQAAVDRAEGREP